MSVTCDSASLADIVHICQDVAALPLLADYGQTAQSMTQLLTRAYQRSEPVRVARHSNGPPAGLSWFLPRGALGSAAYLRLLLICPNMQRKGVGQALMADYELLCADAPGGYFALTTQTNQGARRFYGHQGYQEIGLLPNFVRPGICECLLWKQKMGL